MNSKKIRVAIAVTISGATSGRAISASPAERPGKKRPRSKASAAGTANSVETGVATRATMTLLLAARRRSSFSNALKNHCVLKPVQISAVRFALNAKMISTTSGA